MHQIVTFSFLCGSYQFSSQTQEKARHVHGTNCDLVIVSFLKVPGGIIPQIAIVLPTLSVIVLWLTNEGSIMTLFHVVPQSQCHYLNKSAGHSDFMIMSPSPTNQHII